MSAFIRLVAHTPELQAYSASKLYMALKADISQESLTLAATWIIGEYSEVLLEGGVVDEDQLKPVRYMPSSLSQPIHLCSRQATRTSSTFSSQSSTRPMPTTSRNSSYSPLSPRFPRGAPRHLLNKIASRSC